MTRSPACNMSLRSERLLIVEIIRSCVLNCQQAILPAPAYALRKRVAAGTVGGYFTKPDQPPAAVRTCQHAFIVGVS